MCLKTSFPPLSFTPELVTMNTVNQPASCILCKKVAPNVKWRQSPFEGRQCSCGILYTSPTPVDGQIDHSHDHHPDHFYAQSSELKSAWLAANCPPGKLLEVGCGFGAFLAEANKAGYSVEGLDMSSERCKHVRDKLGFQAWETSLEDNNLEKGAYDVVYHCDLLAHFPDPVNALHEMASLLKPDGVLCFEVGLLGNMSTIWYRLIGSIGLGHHLWLYDSNSLAKLLSIANLEVVKQKRFGLAPSVLFGRAFSAVRFARRLIGLKKVKNERWYPRWQHFFRYRVGAFSPAIGPQTLFVVAKPNSVSLSTEP